MFDKETLTVVIKGPEKAKKGDIVEFNVDIVDGIPPFVYKWNGYPTPISTSDKWKFTAEISGRHIIHVEIVDKKGVIGDDRFNFEVSP